MSVLRAWFQERIPVRGSQIRELTNEPVPNHMKKWWFALGGTPAYLFVVQIVTGILLAFHYQATPDAAYESVRYITEQASYGWYLRSIHKWGATLMIAAVILHQMRVFFTAAYRRPRELNWVLGMLLLLTTLILGFTGYSLVYEQLSYWGATVGANIADRVPIVGELGKTLLLGGTSYNAHTLSRLYVIHAAILPGLLILLITLHIVMVRLHGVTEYRFEGEPDAGGHFQFFPDHLYMELMLGLVLMIVLSVLATVLPATLGPKADPLTTPEIIKPEWFFYVMFRWLKLFGGTFAVLSSGFIIFMMIIWPFIDAVLRKRSKTVDLSFWIGVAAVVVIVSLTVWEAIVAH